MSKFIDKILDSMKLSEGDEYPEDDEIMFPEEDDDEGYGYEYEEPAAPKARPASRAVREDYEQEEDDIPEADQPSRFATSSSFASASAPASAPRRRNSNLVPMRSGRGNMEVSMIKPTSVDDARDICDTIISGRAVIINLEGIHVETAQRIIDFTSGACYSLQGNLQKISNYIFIVTPKAVGLSGDFQEVQADDNMTISSFGTAF